MKRGVLFCLLTVAVHAAVTAFLWPVQVVEMVGRRHMQSVRDIEAVPADGSKEGLFLGDSVNFSYAKDDTDKRRMSAMLSERLPALHVVAVDHKAYHLGVFDAVVRNLVRRGRSPQLVLVPVNLRAFSSHWIHSPGWQFENLQRYLVWDSAGYRLVFRPLQSFRAFRDSYESQESFRSRPLRQGTSAPNTIGRILAMQEAQRTDTAAMRAAVDLYFMETIDERLRPMQDMLNLARRAREAGIRVLFYIGPVDGETCDRYTDGRFSQQTDRNAEKIVAALQAEGAAVVDLHRLLPASAFAYRSPYPDEHLNQAGRKAVAEALADHAGRLLGGMAINEGKGRHGYGERN
jgi:hypothetical protein